MVTLQDSLLSSSARRLPIRKRPDLVARRQQYLGRSYWIVKDPVGLNYYRFQEEEYAILNMLDGETSLDEIKDRFEDEFPPQKITLDELQQFLGMLHRSGLVIAAVGGQGKQLLKRRVQRRNKELLNAVANILCIRFKGFDPERFLNWLYPYVRWFFSPLAFACCILMGLSALVLVLVQFQEFQSRLPAFHQFFNFYNAMWLSLVLAVTKVLHEFGHGLTCKHFGGECHEMGVMVLVLTPCLYCNVSDSWMLPSKWHRAAIGAGGMYVELVLASIATFIWFWTEPGLLNNLCLNVMFVSSVSTVVFNANPLLRYDGYYILADLTEIPNLRQKSTTILSRKLGEWCLGLEPQEDPFLPERNQIFFALYSVAAAIYRWVVVFSILWFLHEVFKPYGLQVIGKIIGFASLWGLLVMPLYQVGKFFYVPGRLEKVKKTRMYVSMAVVGAALAAVALVPLPYSVMATLELQPHAASQVYVDVAGGGQLTEVRVKPGQWVEKGQPLAVLRSDELDDEIASLDTELKKCEARLEALHQQAFSSTEQASANIKPLEAEHAAVREQLAKRNQDRQRLHLTAPVAGTVLPPPPTEDHEDLEEGTLAGWRGTPLDPQNVGPSGGAYLKEGVLFCQIGNPRKMEAILVVDQSKDEFVHEGLDVDIKLEQLPGSIFKGTIDKKSQYPLKITPQRLSTKAGGDLPSTTDPRTGVERPQSTSFQARTPLEGEHDGLLLGLRGQAKIHCQWQSLGQRLWRFLMETFNFKLS